MPFLYKQTKARHQNNPAHHRHGQTFCFQGIVDLKPSCAHEAKITFRGRYILIKSGELTVELHDEKHVLNSGDAAQLF
ncbi:DNA-binding protein [Bacillus velezensis]|nr:DNA-binding protein [Bacillus velezensis]OQV52165.1 DNA-binding protein [Bacillus velezensis]OQV58802.1 DNA-binding protein [Bacillus velezensis]OQV59680.1 DNA-binding protein [Bacillus velezensis]